ncbi:hypothetical protein Tco_0342673, partial [Tanacetum coccineum]
GLSKVDAVDRSLIAREQAIEVMKFHMSRAQNKMKQQANKNRSEREFELKKVHGSHQGHMPAVFSQVNNEGLMEVAPLKILERRIVKKNNVVAVYGLIQWSNGTAQDATWELLADIYKKFPLFDS